MLCSWSPVYVTVYSVINNVKAICRFDKCLPLEKRNEDFFYLNSFVKQLELSPDILVNIGETLKYTCPQLYFKNNLFQRNINMLIKRQFHTNRSYLEEETKTGKNKIGDKKMSGEIKELINKFSSEPDVQLKIIEAYQLGYERSISTSGTDKKKFGLSTNWILFLIFGGYLMYSYMPDFGKNSSHSGSIMKFFSKSWSESGATLVNKVDVKFDDVQGCDEVKKELQDVVSFLKNPSGFMKIGAKLPKGVLLCGEPGLGKTLLAKAVAGESGVPFLYISGSQFDEMFVGVGAARIRSLFNEAKENSPCVVFIDELDAVCSKRTSSSTHPYANQSINQLLAEMDGFLEYEGIIVIGATNRIDALDKAVLRPGRFDLKIQVYPPDYKGRLALFKLYLSKISTNGKIDVPALARSAIGSSGADIKNLVNQAAIICALKGDSEVSMSHLWEAQTKISVGAARSRPTNEKDNILTAYHEAGHSLVTHFSPNSPNKVKLVTIIPRGNSGGHNSFIPKFESGYHSKAELMAIIDSMMGGRAAEELLNGTENISTGIFSDMKGATELARKMVRLFSMSEEVGLQVFEQKNCKCGGGISSPKLAEIIDAKVNQILKESYERAKAIIKEHEKEWHLLAEGLLKYETLEGDDIELVINGKKPKIATISEELTEEKPEHSLINATSRWFGFFSNNIKK